MVFDPSQALNLGGAPSPYGDSFVALDLIKGMDTWRYRDPDGPIFDPEVPDGVLDLDARGWVRDLPVIDGAKQALYGNVFYGHVLPAGQYILEWKGKGDLSVYNEYTVIGKRKILIEFDPDYIADEGTPQDDGITVILAETDPDGTGNYIRDIKLYRAEDADLIAAGEKFNPDWFDRVDDFRILRTHDWQHTNFPTSVDWTRNSWSADQALWGLDGRGMPYELIVEMANETRSDLWINIPHTASDQFIREAAEYVKAHLDPDLRIMVEFSNEYWTTIFDQYQYFVDGGQAAFGDVKFAAGQFYGTRAANMADIFAEVYGEDPQLRPVLTVDSGMFATGEAERMLRAPAAVADGGTAPVTHGFDVIATDGYLSWWAPDPAMAALIRDWMTDTDGGFGRARDFLLDQLYGELLPNWEKGRALADKYGLDFMVYEGGALLLNQVPNADADLTDFAIRFTRSQELREVYEAELEAWATVGSGPFAWYADVGRPGPWGDYGHWKGIEFLPDPRTEAITDANETTPPWWDDGRDGAFFDNGMYEAGTGKADQMQGGALGDRLYGLTGRDTLQGKDANDRLWGGDGDDVIFGGLGRDDMNGGGGNDRLTGGYGSDRMVGGAGNDAFVLLGPASAGDVIADFGAAPGNDDQLVLLGAGFANHDVGGLKVGEFQSSNADVAARAAVRFFFDRDDHTLYYDPDGSGVLAATLIATFQPGAVVVADDLLFF